MPNFRENLLPADENIEEHSSEDAISHVRRRTFTDRRGRCTRRFFMAFLISVLISIELARLWNISESLAYVFKNKSEEMNEYPSLENWTATELNIYTNSVLAGSVFMNILGGLLIYRFSSHKFLFVTVTAISILHALMPTALKHHSTAFLWIVILGQEALAAPIGVAVLSMWKDWAPPDERTLLVTHSFLGLGVLAVLPLIQRIALYPGVSEVITYIVGVAGIIWALIWYNNISSTPQSDPRITEKEYVYLESKIPSNHQEKTSLKEVPWKCILTSKQVTVICLVFFNLGSTISAIKINRLYFLLAVIGPINILLVGFLVMVFAPAVFTGISVLMDYLLRKNRTKTLTIRKFFLCSGLILHSGVIFGSIHYSSSLYVMAVLFAVAYSCWALTIPGILRYPLDISPRYVSIISAVAFGSYFLGQLCFVQFALHVLDSVNPLAEYPLSIYESVLSLVAAVVFGIWGDVEEQSWSLFKSSQRRGDDNSSNPQPENENDIILVPGTE